MIFSARKDYPIQMIYLKKAPFQGEIVLEVFSPQDLKESLNIILETPCH